MTRTIEEVRAYWTGFEDGFSGTQSEGLALTVAEAYEYRKGRQDGSDARERANGN